MARGAPVPAPGALAPGFAQPGRGKGAPGPTARGSRETPPALREVATAAAGRPDLDRPGPRTASPAALSPLPAPSGPPGPRRAPGSQPAAKRSHPAGAPIQSRPLPPAGLRRLPPAPPPPPARTPARQRHPAASRNLTPSFASCGPPRPAANFLHPTSVRASRPDGPAGKEGWPRRAAGPPQVQPTARGVGSTLRTRSADAPARGSVQHTPPPPGLSQPRGSTAIATAGGAAGGGAAKETCHSRRGRPRPQPRRPDGPAREPQLLLQGRAKFLTCSGRRGRESERAGAAAAAAAAAKPGKRRRLSLRRKAASEQLQAPRPRRRPPRLPSAPAARWLRARVWSRGTFCLGAGERPPPPGSPPPAFPTRASHSSSRLSPLVRAPPLCLSLASQNAGSRDAAAAIGRRGGSPPRPMGEGRSCGESRGRGHGGAEPSGATLGPARGRGGAGTPSQKGEGAPAGPAHSGPSALLAVTVRGPALTQLDPEGSNPGGAAPAPLNPSRLRWRWVSP